MRRLTKSEIKECRDYLTEWRTLDEVNALMANISLVSELYAVSQGGLKFWREAWIGMSCAYLTHARRFRLGEDPPDIFLDYGTHEQGLEIVQVLPRGMKISGDHDRYADELSARGETVITNRSFQQKERDLETLPADLRIQIQSKAGKNYPNHYILVVDILHEIFFETDTGSVLGIAEVAKGFLKSFSEIWLRRGNAIVRVSPVNTTLITSPSLDAD